MSGPGHQLCHFKRISAWHRIDLVVESAVNQFSNSGVQKSDKPPLLCNNPLMPELNPDEPQEPSLVNNKLKFLSKGKL